jgi:fructan beta-fructosidase
MKRLFFLAVAIAFSGGTICRGQDDIVIADFESPGYGEWTVTGTAFGTGPAAGTLPGQMSVAGYEGRRLVNSFNQGDDSVGTLESPQFKISKPFLNFLIGGGGWENETAVNLVVDGQVVYSAAGSNTEAGGSERLAWKSWDLEKWQGKQAVIRIVDSRKGGWGHILADHFVLSDGARVAETISRELMVTGDYLHLPVKTGAPKVWVELRRGDRAVRRFEIELAAGEADFVAAAQVGEWKNQTLKLVIEDTYADPSILDQVTSDDQLPASEQIFTEATRPAFHFTSKIGWLNDPNGLVFDDGKWHLFYQHNPFGWNWGNMHWGHATSDDLIRWTEQGDKIHPWSDAIGAAFSGSGLVDAKNSSGLGDGTGDLLVFPFTDTAIGESLAYSNDGGKTLQIFEGNPVVKHQGRDPKVIWHEPTSRWVMAVYTEAEDKQWIAFHTSENLIDWNFESRIEGFYECPDLFELPIAGGAGGTAWVLYAADGMYVLGDFDGRVFKPRHTGKHQLWYGDFYAAQTYSNAPDARRVQIGWGRGIQFPGQRFNQQMVVPVQLSLRDTPDGPRMFAGPVEELARYLVPSDQLESIALGSTPSDLGNLPAPWQMTLNLEMDPDSIAKLDVGGAPIEIDRQAGEIRLAEIRAPWKPTGDRVDLRILVDRGSIELFVDQGSIAISKAWLFGRKPVPTRLSASAGQVQLVKGQISKIDVDRR